MKLRMFTIGQFGVFIQRYIFRNGNATETIQTRYDGTLVKSSTPNIHLKFKIVFHFRCEIYDIYF